MLENTTLSPEGKTGQIGKLAEALGNSENTTTAMTEKITTAFTGDVEYRTNPEVEFSTPRNTVTEAVNDAVEYMTVVIQKNQMRESEPFSERQADVALRKAYYLFDTALKKLMAIPLNVREKLFARQILLKTLLIVIISVGCQPPPNDGVEGGLIEDNLTAENNPTTTPLETATSDPVEPTAISQETEVISPTVKPEVTPTISVNEDGELEVGGGILSENALTSIENAVHLWQLNFKNAFPDFDVESSAQLASELMRLQPSFYAIVHRSQNGTAPTQENQQVFTTYSPKIDVIDGKLSLNDSEFVVHSPDESGGEATTNFQVRLIDEDRSSQGPIDHRVVLAVLSRVDFYTNLDVSEITKLPYTETALEVHYHLSESGGLRVWFEGQDGSIVITNSINPPDLTFVEMNTQAEETLAPPLTIKPTSRAHELLLEGGLIDATSTVTATAFFNTDVEAFEIHLTLPGLKPLAIAQINPETGISRLIDDLTQEEIAPYVEIYTPQIFIDAFHKEYIQNLQTQGADLTTIQEHFPTFITYNVEGANEASLNELASIISSFGNRFERSNTDSLDEWSAGETDKILPFLLDLTPDDVLYAFFNIADVQEGDQQQLLTNWVQAINKLLLLPVDEDGNGTPFESEDRPEKEELVERLHTGLAQELPIGDLISSVKTDQFENGQFAYDETNELVIVPIKDEGGNITEATFIVKSENEVKVLGISLEEIQEEIPQAESMTIAEDNRGNLIIVAIGQGRESEQQVIAIAYPNNTDTAIEITAIDRIYNRLREESAEYTTLNDSNPYMTARKADHTVHFTAPALTTEQLAARFSDVIEKNSIYNMECAAIQGNAYNSVIARVTGVYTDKIRNFVYLEFETIGCVESQGKIKYFPIKFFKSPVYVDRASKWNPEEQEVAFYDGNLTIGAANFPTIESVGSYQSLIDRIYLVSTFLGYDDSNPYLFPNDKNSQLPSRLPAFFDNPLTIGGATTITQ